MIELIFVIVIIGILAAVAMHKLVASKEDVEAIIYISVAGGIRVYKLQ